MSDVHPKIYIVSAARTPIGSFQGALKSLPAPKLGSFVIKAAVERSGVSVNHVDEVIMGEVLTSGVGQAPARQAAIFSGLPERVPCTTINKVCGSGLKAVMIAATQLKNGEGDIVVAGGMESMSNVPYAILKAREGYRLGNGELTDLLVHDGLWDVYNNFHMGAAAELCAKECLIDRNAQDEFAKISYLRAQEAVKEGYFKDEIIPVAVLARKGESILVTDDEEPFRGHVDKLPGLRSVFQKDGTVTAGNASTLNDGAAAVVVASEHAVKRYNLTPIAEILGYAGYAGEPEWFTTAPCYAIDALLKKLSITVDDVDLFEINEAFSVVALVNINRLAIPIERVNVHGGAVALGHPIGASGARILTTLLYALKRSGGATGIASLCIGGGEGIALAVRLL